jgi:hypothetical protein
MNRRLRLAGLLLGCLAVLAFVSPQAQAESESLPTLTIRVTDAATQEPIYQARLTLEFYIPGGFMKKSKWISYSSKTDKKGEYRFTTVPQGKIRLFVTAPDHEAFGGSMKFDKNHQVISVKLRKPQPVL